MSETTVAGVGRPLARPTGRLADWPTLTVTTKPATLASLAAGGLRLAPRASAGVIGLAPSAA